MEIYGIGTGKTVLQFEVDSVTAREVKLSVLKHPEMCTSQAEQWEKWEINASQISEV